MYRDDYTDQELGRLDRSVCVVRCRQLTLKSGADATTFSRPRRRVVVAVDRGGGGVRDGDVVVVEHHTVKVAEL